MAHHRIEFTLRGKLVIAVCRDCGMTAASQRRMLLLRLLRDHICRPERRSP